MNKPEPVTTTPLTTSMNMIADRLQKFYDLVVHLEGIAAQISGVKTPFTKPPKMERPEGSTAGLAELAYAQADTLTDLSSRLEIAVESIGKYI